MGSPLTIHRDWLDRAPAQGVFVTPAALVEAEAFPTSPTEDIAAVLRRAIGEGGTITNPLTFLFDPAGLAWPRGVDTALHEESPHFVTPSSRPDGEKLAALLAAQGPFPSGMTDILGALRNAEAPSPWMALVVHDVHPFPDTTRLLEVTHHVAKLGKAVGAVVVVLFRAGSIQLIAPGAFPASLTFSIEALLSEDGLMLGALHMLIGERRLLSLPEEKRLPALLAASRQTRIRSLQLEDLTVFANAGMELCPSLNVILGPNGSGKSHALKALYALCRGLALSDDPGPQIVNSARKLEAVLRPDEGNAARLLRWGASHACVTIRSERGALFQLELLPNGFPSAKWKNAPWSGPPQVVYLPTREVLSLYELLAAIYPQRQISIDETLWDACQALLSPVLREPPDAMKSLLARLQEIVGGEVVFRNNRFYVRTPDRDVEAPLLAEGVRKLAGLARLVANGSIGPGGLLIWDEPEGNLNPVLVTKAADLLIDLAKQGIQIVVASHDYLFVRHLSLMAEHKKHPDVPIRFFGFCPTPDRGVVVEQGDTLADLDHNPIVDEFTRHVEREQALVFGAD